MINIGNSVSNISVYFYQPKDKKELESIIQNRISKEGPDCDLNDIDTSNITDMSFLFYKSKFNGDIFRWNVSNVRDMYCMFIGSKFNKDISKWDVHNVENMACMFEYSKFNQDISNWNINEDCDTIHIFDGCPIKDEYKPKTLQKK